ncbi:uncharacterized protein LOC134801631 [Cydia splendana]|uniref:uncharacterized protein LOC134801631 n=1 Tax=Cydia splendana TaxID=1100963 RepID=UPI00300D891B
MSESGRIKRYCVFGCDDLGAPMHSFPHPVRRPELFRTWLSIVGDRFKETDPLKIYRNKKICGHHFTSDQKVACHRLMYEAVPSVNLEAAVSKSSCILEIEHNYCIPNSFQQNQSNNKELGQTPENIFSWQTEELIEADSDDPTTPVPEESKLPDDVVTLSLFCDYDTPIQSEPSAPGKSLFM